MTRFALIAACLIGSVAAADEFPEAAVKAQCAQDHPNDFFMQKGCVDLQRMSFFPGTTGLPDDITAAITAKCTAEHPDDFFMRKGCVDLQAMSWRDLNR